MALFSIRIGDDDHGLYDEAELPDALRRYREENPDDPEFRRVQVWEMPPHATVGTPRSVWDFLDE